MKKMISPGILIGILCGFWIFVMGIAGWYKHPLLLNLFWVVIPIQISILIWGLKKTVDDRATYWRQVGAGTLMSLIAGIILFFFSLLFTNVFFPSYFSDLQAMHAELLRETGKSESEIAAIQNANASMETPFLNALSGFLGTLLTGILSSLVIAAFVRHKRT